MKSIYWYKYFANSYKVSTIPVGVQYLPEIFCISTRDLIGGHMTVLESYPCSISPLVFKLLRKTNMCIILAVVKRVSFLFDTTLRNEANIRNEMFLLVKNAFILSFFRCVHC